MKISKRHQQIHSFFSGYALPQAGERLTSCIKAAASDKIWKGRSPADLLWFMEELEKLLHIVFCIIDEKDFYNKAIIDENNNESVWQLARYETYCGRHAKSHPWDFFPRHLSKKEFLNPYHALQKVCNAFTEEEWKASQKTILQRALSRHPVSEFDDSFNPLRIFILLHKLLEAAHLVEVRANNEMMNYEL
jgi:hypothetical protein